MHDKSTVRIFMMILVCFLVGGCDDPGDVCGAGKIYDCLGNCVDSETATSDQGDGRCNTYLDCETFGYDGGDCKDDDPAGTTTTTGLSTTTTSDPTTTTTTTAAESGLYTVVDTNQCQ